MSNFDKIQIISLVGSFSFLAMIFELIRQKKIKEAYALLWLFFGAIFLFFSYWKAGLDYFSAMFGIFYPPAFLFLILIIAIILILVQFSVVVSSQNEKIQKLTQEVALLKSKHEDAEEKKKKD